MKRREFLRNLGLVTISIPLLGAMSSDKYISGNKSIFEGIYYKVDQNKRSILYLGNLQEMSDEDVVKIKSGEWKLNYDYFIIKPQRPGITVIFEEQGIIKLK